MKTQSILKILSILIFLLLAGVNIHNMVEAQEDNFVGEEETSLMTLFVEEGCPYCEIVEEFISKNNLEDEVDIKDIRADTATAALYNEMFDELGVPLEDRGGVPVLFDGSEYFDGADKIITHLGEVFDISVDDYLLNPKKEEDNEEESSNNVVLAILGVGLLASVVFLFISGKKKK
jgi:glutaredoxin